MVMFSGAAVVIVHRDTPLFGRLVRRALSPLVSLTDKCGATRAPTQHEPPDLGSCGCLWLAIQFSAY